MTVEKGDFFVKESYSELECFVTLLSNTFSLHTIPMCGEAKNS